MLFGISHIFAVTVNMFALEVVVRQNEELKDQVKVNIGLLLELVWQQRGLDATKAGKLPESIRLPLGNLSDLTTMEQQLHSEDTFKQLVIV